MTVSHCNNTLANILGLLFLSTVFYLYYQNMCTQFTYQLNYDPNTSTEFQVGSTPLKHFLAVNGNYSANNHSDQADPSSFGPPPYKQQRPSSTPTQCLHYFKELYVVPIPEHDCDQPYVGMNHAGRLGNKMCQYASLYLLRHLYGVRVSITKIMNTTLSTVFKNIVLPVKYSECFSSQTKSIHYDVLFKKLYTAASQATSNTTNNNVIRKPLLDTSYYVYNYPNDRFLLTAHRDLVRSLFRFRDEVIKAAIRNIDAALKPFNATYYSRNFSIVTAHVRRTDYTRHLSYLYNITQLDDLYFKRAFQFYKERLTRPVFLVVSDDPKWCKLKLQAKDVIVIATKFREVDMAAMSLGDHHVTSYGTFSFMGALLGHGNITHPIGSNKYAINKCVDSPFWHHISRSGNFKGNNNNNVVLP